MPNFRFVLIAALLPLAACGGGNSANKAGEQGEAPAAGDYERGPQNGRMLRDGNFAIEMTVFEDGVPPEYRLYAYRDDKPLLPGEVQSRVTIRRLDGETTTFAFRPEEDYLRGQGVLVEPHSFDVDLSATEGGRRHAWRFAARPARPGLADNPLRGGRRRSSSRRRGDGW